jgi:hypothetical protein
VSSRWRFATIGALVVALASLSACSGEPEGRAGVDELRSRVLEESRSALGALTGAGLEVVRATGEASYCRSEPAPGATFEVAGGVADDGRSPAARLEVAREALEAGGWAVVDEQPTSMTLERERFRLTMSETVRQDRAGELAFRILDVDGCVDVPEGFSLEGDEPVRIPTDTTEGP